MRNVDALSRNPPMYYVLQEAEDAILARLMAHEQMIQSYAKS